MAVVIQNRQRIARVDIPSLRRATRTILKHLGRPKDEISIMLVDDREIRNMNRIYLKRDRPTNVIAFPMQEGPFSDLHPQVLGDVVISIETAARDAEKEGMALEDEILYLLIHGILHLLGYDHEGSAARSRSMDLKQRKIFLALRNTVE
jgi:probable rRNA maturation factor